MSVKKLFALSSAILVTAAMAGAAQDPREPPTSSPDAKKARTAEPQKAPIGLQSGTVKKVDSVTKSATIEIAPREGAAGSGADAKETVMYWDETTKIEGGPLKEGDSVQFKTVEKQGKSRATLIKVGKAARPQNQ